MAKTIKVTLIRSRIGRLQRHKATLDGLGLRKINREVKLKDTPAIRGMLNLVSYMVKVERLEEGDPCA